MTMGGTWLVSSYKDVDFKWDIATIPTCSGCQEVQLPAHLFLDHQR